MFDKRLMQMCPESRRYIIGNILLQWLELVMNAVMILIISITACRLYDRTVDRQWIIAAAAGLAMCLVVRMLASKGALRMSFLASRTVKRVMREEIYQKLLRMGTSYRDHASTAELVQESVEGVEQLESYFGQYVPQFFYAFLAPLTLFVLFGAAGSFKVAAVLLICVPLIPGAIMMVQKIARRLLSGYWDQYARLGSAFLENLQGMTALKIYRADAFKNEEMNKESENFRRITMKVLTMQLNSIIIMDFFAYGGAALGIGLALKEFSAQKINLAAVIFMILLSADFFLPMRKLGSYFHVAMNGMAASDRIFTFLGKPESEPKTGTLPQSGLDLCLKDVSFSYDGQRQVLSEISLVVKSGSFYGIVGESGSGKSTIASLVMGRRRGFTGRITLGGQDLDSLSQTSLLSAVTCVSPQSAFFKGTIRENLALADPEACDEKMLEVLALCRLEDLKDKEGALLDVELLENAKNLSGGQKQRLALARALLHDSPLYIFDEATSNIDRESEEAILSVIAGLKGIKTVIMITHRLANVVSADEICCLKEGRVDRCGRHEDLLHQGGEYRKLWTTQKELEDFTKGGFEK